jgi:hypothetical protein
VSFKLWSQIFLLGTFLLLWPKYVTQANKEGRIHASYSFIGFSLWSLSPALGQNVMVVGECGGRASFHCEWGETDWRMEERDWEREEQGIRNSQGPIPSDLLPLTFWSFHNLPKYFFIIYVFKLRDDPVQWAPDMHKYIANGYPSNSQQLCIWNLLCTFHYVVHYDKQNRSFKFHL